MQDWFYQADIVDCFEQLLASKSLATKEHMSRMKQTARLIHHVFDLDEESTPRFIRLAALHDLGKIWIPTSILTKPGSLSDTEWQIIRMHPIIGYVIAKPIPVLSAIADEILTHHERWDGDGYPCRLRGTEIPYLARIVAVVDAYDAMTHDRPYRKAMSREQALEEIKRCAGSQFDPEVVEKFLACEEEFWQKCKEVTFE